MNKEKKLADDFMMSFFDYNIEDIPPDLAAKKDNIKYTDNFTIFKVEKVGTNAIKRIIQ